MLGGGHGTRWRGEECVGLRASWGRKSAWPGGAGQRAWGALIQGRWSGIRRRGEGWEATWAPTARAQGVCALPGRPGLGKGSCPRGLLWPCPRAHTTSTLDSGHIAEEEGLSKDGGWLRAQCLLSGGFRPGNIWTPAVRSRRQLAGGQVAQQPVSHHGL